MPVDWNALLAAVRSGEAAALTFETEDGPVIRSFRPRERLIVLGGGHIALPLCQYAADLGFSVTVVDDRPDFASEGRFPQADAVLCDDFPAALRRLAVTGEDYVAIITRGHAHDADCLRTVLEGTFPRYLGMIGSRKRVAAQFDLLEAEGYDRALLDRVHTPIGLDIHALTVKEIAISIVAELIQCRREGTSFRTKSAVLTSEDVDLPLLEFLALDPAPKALMLVYETNGSSPAKSGAMMAVDRSLRSAGTVGGGSGEHAVMELARSVIGTGTSRCATIDMTNDVAADEGMVCGGRMKVFIQDVG
ncbi:MAG: XdhC family protein [Clostridiales bacterium]|nr:XdhC family protein [Clostridiales bacterium]